MNPKNYSHVTTGLARLVGTPPYLILFVSDACWMKCRHCWFHERWKQEKLTGPPLSVAEYEHLADSIHRIVFLSFTGGEAFMRGDLVDIVAVFTRGCGLMRYQVPTSGFQTELILNTTERLLDANPGLPFRVDVSLDGTRDAHDLIRQAPGSFDRACQTIKELNRMTKHYSYFDVGVISTISHFNQNEVDELVRIVEHIHPDGEWMVNLTRGDVRDPLSLDIDPAAYRLAHKLIQQRIENNGGRHRGHLAAPWLTAKNAVRREIIMETLAGNHLGGGCAAGSLGGVIYPDGNVHACEMFDYPMGSLRQANYDLAAIWKSPTADRVRQRIQRTKCWCTQECFLSTSMLIHPACWPRILYWRMKLFRQSCRTVETVEQGLA